jgi:hypothetical protein
MGPAEELALIDAALIALYTGGASSYSIGARSVTKLDGKWLTERKVFLQNQLDRQTSGMFRLAKFQRTSR